MADGPDVLVIGGGVFGLCCARSCVAAGLTVALAEAGTIGAGASATPVGVLAPHDPRGWSPLKALQLAGLRALPHVVAELEAETGLAVGYARRGRVALLASEAARARVPEMRAAAEIWGDDGEIRLVEPGAPALAAVAPGAAPWGAAVDTLTAQIDTVAYLAALKAAVAAAGVRLLEGWRCHRLEPRAAVFDQGRIAAGQIVLASGWRTLELAGYSVPRGAGVKGQAARLAQGLPPESPVISQPGLYVARHPWGVAVGATSENDWTDDGVDGLLEDVVETARAVVPALRTAPVTARWAGIRPRPPGAGPLVGPLPDRPEILLATGGYKIGLALAHVIGPAVAAEILGATPAAPHLPPSTRPDVHLAKLSGR